MIAIDVWGLFGCFAAIFRVSGCLVNTIITIYWTPAETWIRDQVATA